jgi:hypothetical protein
MKRRKFLAALSAVVTTPLVLLRGKAPAEAAVVAGDRPAGPPCHVGPPNPWYQPDKKPPFEIMDFQQEYMQQWQPPENRLFDYKDIVKATRADRILIEVDHTLLRWHNRADEQRYSRAPWVILEHAHDGAGPGKLVIDQPMPRCKCTYDAEEGRLVDQAHREPHMTRVMEFDLADPYQLLLADLLVRGLINTGVIENRPFIDAWNQTLLDSQNYQFSRNNDGDPDAPVEFIAESLGREFHTIHGPPKRPEGPRRVRSRNGDPAVIRQLTEHHATVDFWRQQAFRVPKES